MTSRQPGGSARASAKLRRTLENALRDDLIVLPLVDEFLAKNPDWFTPPRVAEKIAKLISTPPRDRRFSWSASQSGLCQRRQELAFLGAPTFQKHNAQTIRIFNNGTWVHLRWQAMLMTAGILDDIEVTYLRSHQRSRCTLDGQGVAQRSRFTGSLFGFELKGRNDYYYSQQRANGVDEKTRRQVDFQFYASGLEVISIVNENKNNQGANEWVLYRDEDRVSEVADEIKDLNRAIDRERLHPMLPQCRKAEANGEFFRCPYGGLGGTCEMAGSWPTINGGTHGQGGTRVPRSANNTTGSRTRKVIRRR